MSKHRKKVFLVLGLKEISKKLRSCGKNLSSEFFLRFFNIEFSCRSIIRVNKITKHFYFCMKKIIAILN